MTRVHLIGPSDWEWRRRGPTSRVVQAFGVRPDELRRLPGGASHVWTDDRLVLKPVGYVPEHTWVCEVYAAWRSSDVRVPEPVRPGAGGPDDWSIDGWAAHVWAAGRDTRLIDEIAVVRDASDAFHAAGDRAAA